MLDLDPRGRVGRGIGVAGHHRGDRMPRVPQTAVADAEGWCRAQGWLCRMLRFDNRIDALAGLPHGGNGDTAGARTLAARFVIPARIDRIFSLLRPGGPISTGSGC